MSDSKKSIKLTNVNIEMFKKALNRSIKVNNDELFFFITKEGIHATLLNKNKCVIKRWVQPFVELKDDGMQTMCTVSNWTVEDTVKVAMYSGASFIKNLLGWFGDGMSIEIEFNDRNEGYMMTLISPKGDISINKSCAEWDMVFIEVPADILEPQFIISGEEESFQLSEENIKKIIELSKLKTNLNGDSKTITLYTDDNLNVKVKSDSFDAELNVKANKPFPQLNIDPLLLNSLCLENYTCVLGGEIDHDSLRELKRIIFKSNDSDTVTVMVLAIMLEDAGIAEFDKEFDFEATGSDNGVIL